METGMCQRVKNPNKERKTAIENVYLPQRIVLTKFLEAFAIMQSTF